MPKLFVIKDLIKKGYLKELFLHLFLPKPFPKWVKMSSQKERIKKVLKDKTLLWEIEQEKGAAFDHIEMSGEKVSGIISYGKDKKGNLKISRHIIHPSVRLKPNLTTSHARYNYKESPIKIFLDDTLLSEETATSVSIRGTLIINSKFMGGAEIRRELYPSSTRSALIEKIEITNTTKEPFTVTAKEKKGAVKKVSSGIYLDKKVVRGARLTGSNGDFRSETNTQFEKKVMPSAKATLYAVYFCTPLNKELNFNAEKELKTRKEFTEEMFSQLTVETSCPYSNALFSHCMLRGAESIFQTEAGLLHSPGGGRYYAAIWANDQCEYASPFFPFSGYKKGIEQGVNVYAISSKYVMDGKCVPSSLVGGGVTPFTVAGDRGDTEMYLSGVTRFLLSLGDRELALKFMPSIRKAAEFILNKKNRDGLIYSDSDELEGRFPSGSYNLSTNCLAYDGLVHAERLARALGQGFGCMEEAHQKLKKAILRNFRYKVEGFDTYRYFEGADKLRSWICLPATVGISEAAEETFKALFSDKMLLNQSLKTSSDSDTVWDRALLFSLRGAFITGQKDAKGLLTEYAKSRLTGSHSPYPFEAYPEGNKGHLSAESILYLRVFTEGILNLSILSFSQIKIKPAMDIKVKNLYFNQTKFDVESQNGEVTVRIGSAKYLSDGKTIFDFEEKKWI